MKSFDDLERDELYRSAIADFAVDVPENANADEIKAAFLETGITWADYVKQHPEVTPIVEEPAMPVGEVNDHAVGVAEPAVAGQRVPEPDRGNVISTAGPKSEHLTVGAPVESGTVVSAGPVVRVAEPLRVQANETWLVKMERDNPVFEIAGYRFTQENPYNLVKSSAVEEILREDGFRQAYPSEAAEFYS